ncbi:MAG: hypothetical protein BWY95_00915 [Bacteroidetes bacterium ADurb.BinA104]|nr:MAG: hypothetical protein BWY95_00915 [Bacteroidetes bacterium ADurb.BinA104]
MCNIARIDNLDFEGNWVAVAGKLQSGFILTFNVLIERFNTDANLFGFKRATNRKLSGRVHPV